MNAPAKPATHPAGTFDDVVRGRRSSRGCKPDRLPKTVIREVVDLATGSPSSVNTQPWRFYVVSGGPLYRIRTGSV